MMIDSRELNEFYESFESEITAQTHEESLDEDTGSFRVQVFTKLFCENIVEYGATEDVEICYLDRKFGRGIMRANAYCVNDEAGRVTLIASIYQPGPLATVPKKDIEIAVQRAARVFEAALNGYHEGMEPATEKFSMMQRIAGVSKDTLDLQILVLTNGKSAGSVDDISLPDLPTNVRWQVWDIIRLQRCMASGKAYESISIDLSVMPTGPLPCLKMPKSEADYDAYLAIIPGALLYQLYDEYGPKLLELNVRSFLQARGKVNRGIKDTVRHEPMRFLAYNNGISVTAEEISTRININGGLEITQLEGFQVVNGGQTMASIHRARKVDQADLDDVYVQAKITVVESNQIKEIIPKISMFSNTQNKVNEADFSSNDPFHVEIERLSEKVWCPGEQTRWFYERARGQYQVARTRKGTTPARRRDFDATTPRSQNFDKTSLAKYINAWDQLPHIVSLGNQKNFVRFMGLLKNRGVEWRPDEHYYRELIAKAMIFKRSEKIARQHKFPSYRAQTVAYTVSLLSYRTIGRVDLNSIWQNQGVSDSMADTIFKWMPKIWDGIVESAGEKNVTEWCKKEECWRIIQTLDVEIPKELQDELADGQPLPTVGSQKGQRGLGLTHLDRENIATTMQLSGEEWLKIHAWANEKGLHHSMGGIALTLSGYAANNWQKVPSAKQAKQAVKMITDARSDNIFTENQNGQSD